MRALSSASLLLASVALLSTACASASGTFMRSADTVKFPRGAAFQAYADMRVAYALTHVKVSAACAAAKLGQQFCQVELPRYHEEMQNLDAKIMNALANPSVEVDWEAVGAALKIIIKVVGAAL